MVAKGHVKRKGSPAWRRPSKDWEEYVRVLCPNCLGKRKDCPLCEGHLRIWVVP